MKITLAAVAISACRVAAQLVTTDFVLYPGYTGDLVVGKVYIGEVAQKHQVVFADLTNVDAECTGAQNGENNTCGIHIHEGTDCGDAKGHYWDKNFVVADPWQPVTYTGVTDKKTKVEDIVVGTGFNLADLEGRTFVVHDSTGTRVACALLANVGAAIKSMEVAKFGKYPLETGKDVTATVTVDQHAGEKQVLKFDIRGGDAGCTPGLVNSAKNGCGVHIHSGTTCEYHDQVGGHHYKDDRGDPWLKITYRTANARGITIPVDTGLTGSEVYGRTVVVHDKDGGRMACGRILLAENPPLKTMPFNPYFGYEDVLKTEGMVSVGQSGTGDVGTQVLFAMLNDTDPACNGNQDSEPQNVCGMHIHTGKNCSAEDGTGGHYWNTAVLGGEPANDPWTNRYTAEAPDGDVSQVNEHIKTAFDLEDMEGRAFVVHDSTSPGRRVACALLERATVGATLIHENDFEKYPGTSSTLVVSGQVGVHQSGESAQFLTYSLSGLDEACTADKVTADNECGIHIHEGTSCESSGGHHWDKSIQPDPWLRIRYVATSTTGIFTGTTVAIETGIALSGLYGRALVVHDASNKRIACTLIQSAPTTPAPSPGDPPAPSPGGTPAPSPGGTPAPTPAEDEDDDGPPVVVFGIIGIIVVGCCGAGGWFYMNQESSYDTQEDAGEGGGGEPEIEMQNQE